MGKTIFDSEFRRQIAEKVVDRYGDELKPYAKNNPLDKFLLVCWEKVDGFIVDELLGPKLDNLRDKAKVKLYNNWAQDCLAPPRRHWSDSHEYRADITSQQKDVKMIGAEVYGYLIKK